MEKKRGKTIAKKNILNTVKFAGGSVMFWGRFSYKGVGNLVVIEGIMDRFQYLDIIRKNIVPSAEKLEISKFSFQQNNDPKHTSNIVKDFFVRNNIHLVDHPAQSSDINPIEHLWAHIKKKLENKNFLTRDALITEVRAILNSIPLEVCQNLIMSMKKRVKAVIQAEGRYIVY